ncbi:beta-ketoacyl synthase chain length factor [Cupriavidus nantongensis]|uniref:beta-ketoacyl synthase chain length factor n=1 Tax=Cupriavidus nantongensis TaxID=1796606 RepID=UPI00358DE978
MTSGNAHSIRASDGGVAFGIRAWSAWTGDLQSQHDWQAWSANPHLPPATAQAPALPEMAAMLRRRLPLLGRVALASVYACAPDDPRPAGMPTVFASRHGDTARLVTMLTDLAAAEPLSPTAFGLAVHNAIGAVRSIDLADMNNLQALSAGRDTVETAVLEACSLLADGAPEVMLVNYDAPIAGPYAPFADEPGCLYSWCWRIATPREGEPWYALTLSNEPAGTPASPLPHGLDVLRFMLSGDARLHHRGERASWHWQRHG